MEATCFGFEEDEGAAANDRIPCPAKFVKPTFRFVCNVPSKSRVARAVVQNVHPEEPELTSNVGSPISITQVQELLLEDLSPTKESSFYEELQNEETQNSEWETSTGEIQNFDDRENARNIKKTPVRAFGKTVRNKKRPLEEIQNFDSSTETSLQDTIVKPIVKKKGKKDVENEKNDDRENNENIKKTPVRVFGKTVRNKKRPLEEIQNFDDNTEMNMQDAIVKPVVKKKGKKDIENERNEILLNEMAERMNSKFKAVEEYQLVVE